MSRTKILILAVFFIVIDSIGTYIPGVPVIFRWLGKLAAPCFLFCMARGMDRVREQKKYLPGLYLSGVGMGILNFLLCVPSLIPNVTMAVSANLFTTMFASGSLIVLYEYQKEHPGKRFLVWGLYGAWQLGGFAVWCILSEIVMIPTHILQLVFTVCGNLFFAEGSFLLVFLGFLLYRTRERKRAMCISYGVIFLIYFLNASTGIIGRLLSYLESDIVLMIAELLTGLSIYGTWVTANFSMDHLLFYDFQWMMIAALPILLLYREKQEAEGETGGRKSCLLWILYPVSVYLLWFLGNYVL